MAPRNGQNLCVPGPIRAPLGIQVICIVYQTLSIPTMLQTNTPTDSRDSSAKTVQEEPETTLPHMECKSADSGPTSSLVTFPSLLVIPVLPYHHRHIP